MSDALYYLLDDIFIRFGSKLYQQIVGIQIGTNCASLVADMFYCFAIRVISCCLFLILIKLVLLKLLTLSQISR